MTKPSLLDTLTINTSGKTYIDPDTTQTIIKDIAADMKRKIAKAEEQSAKSEQEVCN